jgi:hypothetical protein
VFVISSPDAGCVYLPSVEQIKPALRSSPPGRYDIEKISVDPLTADRTSRHWGVGVKDDGGSIAIEPAPWEPCKESGPDAVGGRPLSQ